MADLYQCSVTHCKCNNVFLMSYFCLVSITLLPCLIYIVYPINFSEVNIFPQHLVHLVHLFHLLSLLHLLMRADLAVLSPHPQQAWTVYHCAYFDTQFPTSLSSYKLPLFFQNIISIWPEIVAHCRCIASNTPSYGYKSKPLSWKNAIKKL